MSIKVRANGFRASNNCVIKWVSYWQRYCVPTISWNNVYWAESGAQSRPTLRSQCLKINVNFCWNGSTKSAFNAISERQKSLNNIEVVSNYVLLLSQYNIAQNNWSVLGGVCAVAVPMLWLCARAGAEPQMWCATELTIVMQYKIKSYGTRRDDVCTAIACSTGCDGCGTAMDRISRINYKQRLCMAFQLCPLCSSKWPINS